MPLTSTLTWIGGAGDDAGPHQRPQLAQARVAQLQLPVEAEAEPEQRRQLHAELRQAAQKHADADPVDRRARRTPGAARSPAPSESKAKAQATPAITETMLNTVEAEAGMPKMKREFSIPITAAASETKRMKGKRTRVRLTASSNLPGTLWKPKLVASTISGAPTMATTETIADDEDHRAQRQVGQLPGRLRRLRGPRCG